MPQNISSKWLRDCFCWNWKMARAESLWGIHIKMLSVEPADEMKIWNYELNMFVEEHLTIFCCIIFHINFHHVSMLRGCNVLWWSDRPVVTLDAFMLSYRATLTPFYRGMLVGTKTHSIFRLEDSHQLCENRDKCYALNK